MCSLLRIVAAAAFLFLGAGALGATASTRPAPGPDAALGNIHGHVSLHSTLVKPDLTRAVVYLAEDPALASSPAPDSPHPFVAQHNKAFVPNFLVIPVGTAVEFPNWDPFDHNVFSRSAAAPAFDLARYPYGSSKARTFTKVGVVQVFCNIHPQMRAVILVTPNAYFARCDADGNFLLSNVPAGTFHLVAWSERTPEARQPVTVRPGETAEASLDLSPDHDHVIAAADRPASAYGVERGLGVKREVLGLPVVHDCHPAPADSKP